MIDKKLLLEIAFDFSAFKKRLNQPTPWIIYLTFHALFLVSSVYLHGGIPA